MALRIEKTFVVAAPADAVWAFLTDPRKVASCLPGAAITEDIDAQTFAGTITVKVGPVVASYRGRMRFERLDAAAREAEIVASGQETRGKGAADMRMSSRVVARSPAETEVVITSEVNVVGVLAQFGRGMIQDVSDQMFEKFTAAARRQLEPQATTGAPTAAATAPTASGAAASPPSGVGAELVSARVGVPSGVGAPPTGGDARTEPPARAETSSAPTPEGARSIAATAAQTENVLDLGALGTAAAGRATTRVLHSATFWLVVAALVAVALLVFR